MVANPHPQELLRCWRGRGCEGRKSAQLPRLQSKSRVFLRSPAPARLCLVSRGHLSDANLPPILVYLRKPQAVPEGFQAASLPRGLSASKRLAPSPARCWDAFLGACGLFHAGSISCRLPSADKFQFSVTCDNNECGADG